MSDSRQRQPAPGSASDIKRSRDFWLYGADNPKSIKAERNLSQLAEWDDRLTPAARKVLDFLIDWEHDGRGDALASREHIAAHLNARAPDGCKISVRTVRDGIDCLLASGWAVRTLKGTGQKNASRYVVPPYILENAAHGILPNVANRALHDAGLATTSTGRDVTPCTGREATPGNASAGRDVTPQDTTTQTRLPDAATSSSNGSIGAATPPPPGDGLAATPLGETPLGGFEDFWNSYAHKQKRKDAKAAWAKLAPDTELAATIITEAGRWAKHYAKHNVEPRWRVLPHNWLAGENWLQDLPIIHTDAKGAAIANVLGRAKPGKAAKPGQAAHPFPAGETKLTIRSAEQVKGEKSSQLALVLSDGTGRQYEHSLTTEHYKPDVQEAAQDVLESFVVGAGFYFNEPKPDELVGRYVVAIVDEDGLSWHGPRDGQPKTEHEPAPAKRRRTIEEAQAEYDEWYEASLAGGT